jgi:transcription initiation factor TFIIB
MYREFSAACIFPDCIKCPTIIDESAGEIICQSCGRVFAERIETSEEPHFYSLESDSPRTKSDAPTPLIMYDRGLQSIIGTADRDARGKTISKNTKKEFERLRSLNGRCLGSKAHNLRVALVSLNALATKLAIPSAVKERAAYLCRKAMENRLAVGRTIESVMCASLYVACRETHLPRTIDEIADTSNTPKKNVLRTYKALLEALKLQSVNHSLVEFVNRLGNQVNATEQTKRNALGMLSEITKNALLTGRSPIVVAAATLYLACVINNEELSQRQIAKTAGICASTIRSTVTVLGPSSKKNQVPICKTPY